MAEYVNRDKLVRDLECGIRAGNYEDGYEKYMHINDMDDCVDTVKYFDKADVVEQEKIDKAIDEVYKIRKDVLYANGCYEPDDVLDIMDQITKLFEEI
jgi:hypothetical protein